MITLVVSTYSTKPVIFCLENAKNKLFTHISFDITCHQKVYRSEKLDKFYSMFFPNRDRKLPNIDCHYLYIYDKNESNVARIKGIYSPITTSKDGKIIFN